MAGTITVSGKYTGYTHTLVVDVESQDSVANTTTVSYSYGLHREVSKAHGSNLTGNVAFHAILNGVDNVASPTVNFGSVTDFEVVAGEQTIANAENGTLSFTVELKTLGLTGSSYLKPADKTVTFIVDPVDRSSSFVISPLPVVGGGAFDVAITRLDTNFTHNVYMTDSSGNVTTVASAVATDATGTAPALGTGLTSDAASIDVDTLLSGTVIGTQTQDLLIWSAPDAPPVNLATPFDFRFRNMVVSGSTIVPAEVIPFTTANFTDTLSDTSTCSITTQPAIYPTDLDMAVVMVEVFTGAAWVSNGLLFSLTRSSDDKTDIQDQITYQGTAYLDFILGKGILGSKAKHSKKTSGYIVADHFNSAHGRGWGPLAAVDFSSSKTSAGTKWYGTTSQSYDAGTPLLQIIQGFVQGTQGEYRCSYNPTTSKAVLQMQNPGYGYDWTLTTSKTIVNFKTSGVFKVVTTAPVQKDYSGLLTRVTATGSTTSKKIKVRNPTTGRIDTETKSSTLKKTKTRSDLVNPLYGHLEARVDASGVSSGSQLTTVADDVIIQANQPVTSRQFTYNVDSQEINPALWPYRIFRTGDWVFVPGDNNVLERDRIQQIVVTKDSENTTVNITTGDLLPTGAAALYRYVRRSTGGAIPGGVMTNTPSDAAVIAVSPVTNLTPTTTSTFDSNGLASSVVTLSWTEVTTDLDGNDLAVPSYQILSRSDYTAEWNTVATAQNTTVDLPALTPGTSVDLAVVPIADDGTIGDPDDYITVVTPDPDAMVGAPDTPTLASDAMGNLTITWDGLMAGVAPSPEFSFVRAEISANGTSGWSPAGSQLSAAGSTTIQDVGAGTWYIHLVPVDSLARSGTPSAVATQVVTAPLADMRIPKAPTGLAVTSTATWSGSEPTSNITATWTAVTQATDNSAMTMLAYELWGKLSTDTNYGLLTTASGSVTTVSYNDIGPLGSTWDFELRATGSDVVQSAFSSVAVATIAVPSLTLDPPTAPDLTTFRGLLLVSWDGNLLGASAAYAAPDYLANVDIWVSVDGGTTYTRQGFLQAGSRTQAVAGLGVGATATVYLTATDVVGNITAPSVSAAVVITGISGGDIEVDTLNGNTITAGTLNVDRVSPAFGANLNLAANGSITLLSGNIATTQAAANSTASSLAATQTRYSFTPTAAIISQPGSTSSVSISSTEVDFIQAGVIRAFLNSGIFNAPKITSTIFNLTHHVIEDDPAGAGTIIKRF